MSMTGLPGAGYPRCLSCLTGTTATWPHETPGDFELLKVCWRQPVYLYE
jgi:hypothetical protein